MNTDNQKVHDTAQTNIALQQANRSQQYLFEYGFGNVYINVTELIYKHFVSNGILTIKNAIYNDLFTDPFVGKVKSLKITNNIFLNNPVYVQENSHFCMNINLTDSIDSIGSISIVYFINTYVNNSYQYMMMSQLTELKNSGILTLNPTIYIMVSCSNDSVNPVTDLVKHILPTAIVCCTAMNNHEYPGIKKVWDIGQQNTNGLTSCSTSGSTSGSTLGSTLGSTPGLTLYFHSKGISHIKQPTVQNCRTRDEKVIFKNIVTNWRKNLEIFRRFPSVYKLGMNQGGDGWMWFNFWWVRNEYSNQCVEPIITENRYYYEDWLGRYIGKNKQNNLSNGYSVSIDANNSLYNIGTLYEPSHACSLVDKQISG